MAVIPTIPIHVTAKDLCFGDRFCVATSETRIWKVVLAVNLIYGVGITIAGLIIGTIAWNDGANMLTIFDLQEGVLAFLVGFVYSPLVWFFYMLQPRLAANVLDRLHMEGFLHDAAGPMSLSLPIWRAPGFARRQPTLLAIWNTRGTILILAGARFASIYCFGVYSYEGSLGPSSFTQMSEAVSSS